MNNSAVDIAIGLILTYLVLSLLCTVINECIATLFDLRARTLEKALTNVIDAPQLKSDFYNHGLIDGGKAANRGAHVPYLCGQSFATALIYSLDATKPMPAPDDIINAVKNLPDSNIRDVLLVELMSAGSDINKLRDNLTEWFNCTMEHVTGVYKRRLKILSLAVGILLAVAVNADSLAISRALWHDSALRARVAAVAEKIPTDTKSQGELGVAVSDIFLIENAVRPLPFGWNAPDNLWGGESRLARAAGLLFTGLALSLGAPFWFDLLSRFINIRGTGKRPDANP
jgi:hypothetical protein